MKEIRIRSVMRTIKSDWVYSQEFWQPEKRKEEQAINVMAMSPMQKKARTNQYARFRYSDLQYGKIEAMLSSYLEINKAPKRIRQKGGDWLYTDNATILGAAPAIRIRNGNNESSGQWVYVQHQEV